jgi:hypothetical protein
MDAGGYLAGLSNRSYVWLSLGPAGPVFFGFFFNLVGKRSVGNPRPLAGDGLSIRSAQGRVWSTQEPAKPAVHTLVVWTAGLSTRARAAFSALLGCFEFGIFSSSPPQGLPEAPRLGHVLMVQPRCCARLGR